MAGNRPTLSTTSSPSQSRRSAIRSTSGRTVGQQVGLTLTPPVELFGPLYLVYFLRIENAKGYVLIAVYLFICMRVTRINQ